jgi:CheY-like chemotaxis protein
MNDTPNTYNSPNSAEVFARAGIPFPVILSRELQSHYHLPDDELAPQRIELIWVVRLVLSGCLPSRQVDTPRGRARVLEYNCIDHPKKERCLAILTAPDGKSIDVVLPEELADTRQPRLVLLVDDDPDVAACGALMLEAAGYRTAIAENGAEGWRWLNEADADAILSDVNMPKMDGIELCRRIRASPRFRQIPVLTWSGNPGHQPAAMAAGASSFLNKPVDLAELKARLQAVLNR